jgi:hypothetical protein
MFCAAWCSAQLNYDYTAGRFLIKGTVIDVETHNPLPLVNIRINSGSRGTTADNEGLFTLYVSIKDTLKFTSTGYISKTLHVSDLDSTKYYIIEVELMRDFIKLKDITIYPYKDLDDFKKAFVDAKNVNKVTIYGIAPPKYSNKIPSAKLSNPISYLYERLKRRKAANPDFKP